MPFTTVKDYENYISRLHAIPRALEQTTEVMKLGLRDRLMPPKYLLEKVGEQAQGIADDKPESSPYAQPAEKFPAAVSAAEQERLRKRFWPSSRRK